MKCERVETEVVKVVETKVKEVSYNLNLTPIEALFLRALLGNMSTSIGELGDLASELRSRLHIAGFSSNGSCHLMDASNIKFNFTTVKELQYHYSGHNLD